jgi:hypothetical protein
MARKKQIFSLGFLTEPGSRSGSGGGAPAPSPSARSLRTESVNTRVEHGFSQTREKEKLRRLLTSAAGGDDGADQDRVGGDLGAGEGDYFF